MLKLVLIVTLRTQIAIYPMPDMGICEHWAGESAAWPHVQAVECRIVDPLDFQGRPYVWQQGAEGKVL